jgi:hypothetical protein
MRRPVEDLSVAYSALQRGIYFCCFYAACINHTNIVYQTNQTQPRSLGSILLHASTAVLYRSYNFRFEGNAAEAVSRTFREQKTFQRRLQLRKDHTCVCCGLRIHSVIHPSQGRETRQQKRNRPKFGPAVCSRPTGNLNPNDQTTTLHTYVVECTEKSRWKQCLSFMFNQSLHCEICSAMNSCITS